MAAILVIDDEPNILEDLCMLLELAGFTAVGAKSGREGLEAMQGNQFDLILCDISMPEMDGYELLEIVHGEPAYASIPFVFVTARASQDDVEQAMESGVAAYITKPFSVDDLFEIIHRLTGIGPTD